MAIPWLELVLAPRADDAESGYVSGSGKRDRLAQADAHAHDVEDERALLIRVRDGDVSAFERLFRTHYADTAGFAESLIGAPDSAEDVVQTVWWEVWQHRDRLDPDRPVRAYLFTAVRNRARNAQRDSALALRRAWDAAMEARLERESDDETTRDEFEQVRRALTSLPERDREILVLRLRGMTFAEIGEILGVPLKTVATRSARTLERLRNLVLKGKNP